MNRPAKFAGSEELAGRLSSQAKLVKLAEGYIEGISPHLAPRPTGRGIPAREEG